MLKDKRELSLQKKKKKNREVLKTKQNPHICADQPHPLPYTATSSRGERQM